jgi:3-hydroxybutyrate dehydrogenase
MDRFLAGRTAWVSDGASDIGRATALALAGAGANVAFGMVSGGSLLAAPPEDSGERLTQRIKEQGVDCFAANLDLGSNAGVDQFHTSATAALGPVDILVNSAGLSVREEIIGHRDEVWQAVIETNLNACYRTIKWCIDGMIERGYGRIINIASTAATVGYPGYSAYCAAKAAVLGLTRCVALEGAEHGVTCNAINPGWVHPGINTAKPEEMPQERWIPPEEVAGFILFLCHDDALGLTGESVPITGGSVGITGFNGRIW